ncbi:MAG: preprotein translocase subunit YajC [Bacteroidia bacterium]|nr:preprotein translocase subunit YajC [Bacteroidia bacterium]
MIETILAMAPQDGAGGGQSMVSTLVFFALIFVVFYFMILRPQQKRAKERQKMLDSIKKGDKVVTSGGMHGKVVNVDDATVLLDVGDNIKLKFDRSAINVITREGSAE